MSSAHRIACGECFCTVSEKLKTGFRGKVGKVEHASLDFSGCPDPLHVLKLPAWLCKWRSSVETLSAEDSLIHAPFNTAYRTS